MRTVTCSEVPECKIVGNPVSLGEAIQVKERQTVYTGLLVAVGSKQEVQEKVNTIEEIHPVSIKQGNNHSQPWSSFDVIFSA